MKRTVIFTIPIEVDLPETNDIPVEAICNARIKLTKWRNLTCEIKTDYGDKYPNDYIMEGSVIRMKS